MDAGSTIGSHLSSRRTSLARLLSIAAAMLFPVIAASPFAVFRAVAFKSGGSTKHARGCRRSHLWSPSVVPQLRAHGSRGGSPFRLSETTRGGRRCSCHGASEVVGAPPDEPRPLSDRTSFGAVGVPAFGAPALRPAAGRVLPLPAASRPGFASVRIRGYPRRAMVQPQGGGECCLGATRSARFLIS